MTVRLWDTATGDEVKKLKRHSHHVTAVAFSPDGKLLALASDDARVKLWNAGSGAALQTPEGHLGLVNAVAFSPDSKLPASASKDKMVKLWDASLGVVLQTLKVSAYKVPSHPDPGG
jgi:WD40 repeat protein